MENSSKIRVIAAIVDDRQLTLYKEDGSTIVILQGDERLAKIIKTITPILAAGPGNVAEVNISEIGVQNSYLDFEKQTKGKVSFFKLAKSKLAGFLGVGGEPYVPIVAPQVIGAVPSQQAKTDQLLAATAEIIKHAQPVSSPEFHERDVGTKGDATIVAVVNNKVIGAVEQIKPQLKRAVLNPDSKGMVAFMERVTAVADKRRHSADDLLKFLEKGDLPIAEDGSIVIYKVLQRKGESYVDCHTRKVTQRVGSYVVMDENLVDPNRYNECSNGLHVARRAYVGGFNGDVCVLAKVHPEDVIAVPSHDANKMRVCGYHILFELSSAAFQNLKHNKAFTDNEEAQLMLGQALAGDHPEPIEEVRITDQMGNGVKVTPWITLYPAPVALESKIEASVPKGKVLPVKKKAKVVVKATKALPDEKDKHLSHPNVNPKAIVAQVGIIKAKVESRKDKAHKLHTDFLLQNVAKKKKLAAKTLLEFKKTSKVSWSSLGLADDTGTRLQFVMDQKG